MYSERWIARRPKIAGRRRFLPRRFAAMAVLLAGGILPGPSSAADAVQAAPHSGARMLPIASDGFAGSSINVVSGLQHTLFTHHGVQYAAFYAADATLVLARRQLGRDAWESTRTSYRANVNDAHNTVALIVDGAGYLHVAWDHHNNALNYCRSVAPGSLELGPKQPMTGNREQSVSYPQFLRLPDGDLLFFYRDGGSGRGNLVLNRYTTATGEWRQVHANLLDGEGQRNAYASVVTDDRGGVHVAWTWRETPDVATNHDLCYARSADGGETWTDSSGQALTVPITAASAEYVRRIPQNRSLMNPPSITVDARGNPYIANYWTPEGSDVPQYHLVFRRGESWETQQVTQRTSSFFLGGAGTKRPPISRSAVFVQTPWRRPAQAFLLFRDDASGGRIVAAASWDLAAGQWAQLDLTTDSVGAWEPSYDPEQWRRLNQVHMLVQPVEQRDGNDREAADVPPTTVSAMIWSPFISAMVAGEAEPATVPAAGVLDRPLVRTDVLAVMERVADWQLDQPMPEGRDPRGWETAPFLIGALELAELSADSKYHDAILARAEANDWQPGPRVYHADDHCVIQAYGRLYRRHHDERMLAPSRARLDEILADSPETPLHWGWPGNQDRWSWCDALFMGPASWLTIAHATGEEKYVDYANREFWATVDALYRPEERFFARDESYVDLREPNGRRLFWSRGNGWVVAGLCHVLELFPPHHPDYARYAELYWDMMDAVLAAQQPDGLWRPGLLDPERHTAKETSGSSFMTFALAWGVNQGLLDRARVTPHVRRAWHALTSCVAANGRLEHVQPIGAAPEGFDPEHSDWFGVGAFLLAGSQVYRLADN